jgi:hypothetical protein
MDLKESLKVPPFQACSQCIYNLGTQRSPIVFVPPLSQRLSAYATELLWDQTPDINPKKISSHKIQTAISIRIP